MFSKRLVALMLTTVMVCSAVSCNQAVPPKNSESESVSEEASSMEVSEPVEPVSIINDNFDDNTTEWGTYGLDGAFELAVENGEMVVKITDVGTKTHGVQVFRDGFSMTQGAEYTVEFDVRSDIERNFEWRIQMNGGKYEPYYVEESAHIATEYTHISATFIMGNESDPAPRFCFNLGKQGELERKTTHNVYIDNVVVMGPPSEGAEDINADANKVNLNQIGYYPNDTKTFVAVSEGDTDFEIIDATSQASVYQGTIKDAVISSVSAGQDVIVGDFSDFTTPGSYIVHLKNAGDSYPFAIADDINKDIFKATVKMLYMQRCGCELTSDMAGKISHPVCHNAQATLYGTDIKLDVSGGWHDAGDYGRYVVPGAKTVMDLMLTYEDSGNNSDDFGIPESGNKTPDLLDEARYELDWMLKMQADNGGVYHKVTCTVFPESVMPEMETAELIVCPISTTATGDFAAVMAKASVVYKEYDSAFADSCLKASQKAFEYMDKNAVNDTAGFKNPTEIVTGEYPDTVNDDEFFWAAVELFIATNDRIYLNSAKKLLSDTTPLGLGWADVGIYGLNSILCNGTHFFTNKKDIGLPTDSEFYDTCRKMLLDQADKKAVLAQTDGYFLSLGDAFPWGSNMTVANNGMLYSMAYKVSSDSKYLQLSNYQTDYLLGMNPLGYCYVTGFGTLSPASVHHRPTEAIGEAIPGMLVGGPNNALEDPYAAAVLLNSAPAKSYVDNTASYSTNEVAIYWNSPLIYLLSNR